MVVEDLTKLIWETFATICDPEVPVLSILDLGIVRKVDVQQDKQVIIYITPTYSGCPAMGMITSQIRIELLSRGVKDIIVKEQLAPAWTTDWMSSQGREKLEKYGIAPPKKNFKNGLTSQIRCLLCQSENVEEISEFGSTSCKSLYRCLNCKEPFDYFKCI